MSDIICCPRLSIMTRSYAFQESSFYWYDNEYIPTPHDMIAYIAKEDMKDEFGYLPAKKDSTRELKRLLKRYAPNSYADWDVAELINNYDLVHDDYGWITKPPSENYVSWYILFKEKLYSATKATDLFYASRMKHRKTTYDLWIGTAWDRLVKVREAVRWELEPALIAQKEKEKDSFNRWQQTKTANKTSSNTLCLSPENQALYDAMIQYNTNYNTYNKEETDCRGYPLNVNVIRYFGISIKDILEQDKRLERMFNDETIHFIYEFFD